MVSRKGVMVVLVASIVINGALLAYLFASSRARPEAGERQLAAEVIDDGQPISEVMAGPTLEPVGVLVATATQATPTSQPTATDQPTVTEIPVTSEPTSTSLSTVEPTAAATATTEPTPTPSPTLTITPTAVLPEPTPTPVPTMTATPTAVPVTGPEWLNYLNLFRQEANLPPLIENVTYSIGSGLHSSYMVQTEHIAHFERQDVPVYSVEGDRAARMGNLVYSVAAPPFNWAIEYWISAPFHAVPILDPQLQAVGFGTYYQNGGAKPMAAVLNVLEGVGNLPPDITYPLTFPRDGGQTWVVRHSMYEWPDPYSSCTGYDEPTGPPVILQIGSGERTPRVTSHSFRKGETELAHCIYDETNYVNPDPYAQDIGRTILDERDAIVLIPRAELQMGQTYTVSIVVNGETVTWSFSTVPPPWKN